MTTKAIAAPALLDVLNGANQGIILLDRKGAVVFANQAASDLFGRATFEPEDIAPAMTALQGNAKVKNVIMAVFHAGRGQRSWFSVDAHPVYGKDENEPSLACQIVTDITEAMTVERDLRQSRLHLVLAQRIASIGSAAVDFKTGKWDWSEETFRVYGVDPKTFVPSAENLGSLVHPEDWPALYENVPRAESGSEPEPVVEYRITRPDGAERIVRRIATAVKDEAGAITGIVATVQDVTELRIAQRENKVLQSQLYQAQRLDSLGALAGGIAHDLNNTLVPVLALSDSVLLSLPADDPMRPVIELIRQGGQRASDLVTRILTFARREEVVEEVIDVRTFLRQLVPLMRASVPASIKIVENLNATARVRGSPGQLHQVVLNLFSNAAQAIGDKSGHIYLSTADIAGARDGRGEHPFIQISVADTGTGMSDAVKARIFKPFFSTKAAGGSLGLGLSVVQGIVAGHGGHIEVTSAPGEGTRMDVLIPVADD